jgi:hypothetical protein
VTWSRANAVPETALVVSFTLLTLYGTIQLATTAFYQMSADGASFVAAHDTVQSVGDPTSANASAAGTTASTAFEKIVKSSVSALNPSASTFEADVTQSVPGITALGNATPLTISSRLIETSAGSATASPLSNCAQGSLNLVGGGATKLLNNVPVGLLQGGTLESVSALSGSATATMNLNTTALTTRLSTLNTVSSSVSSVVSTLKSLQVSLSTLGSLPLIGAILAPLVSTLQTNISSDLQAPVANAFSGTFSATTALTTINSQLTSQVPALGSLLGTVIDPLLTGAGGVGILGSSGPLASLNTAMSNLSTLDSGAVTCP